jgi:hypothetical protein
VEYRFAICLAFILGVGSCATWATGATSTHSDGSRAVGPSEEEKRVLASIDAERSRRSLPPLDMYNGDPSPLAQIARRIRQGAPVDTVLETAIHRLAHMEETEVSGWADEAAALDELGVPPPFVERAEITVALVVERHGASGRYVACFFVIEDGIGAELGYE